MISAVAALIAGGVTVYKAGSATRVEIAASMDLAELLVADIVRLLQRGEFDPGRLKALPSQLRSLRHVRLRIEDAAGQPLADHPATSDETRARPPAWFSALIGPPPETRIVPIVVAGQPAGAVRIVSEPTDEIAEVWESTVALGLVALLMSFTAIAIFHLLLGHVLAPLTGLAHGLRDLENRNYRVRLPRPGLREFADITDRFNALAAALDAARADNLDLSRRLITAQDDERRRTALDLHDEVGPSLFGLKAQAGSLTHAASNLPAPAGPDLAARARDILAIVDHLQSLNRGMLNRLRPMALGQVPLSDLLAELVRERAREHATIAFSHAIDGLMPSYGEPVDLTVYRCLQESLTNAVRHARPGRVTVTISDSRNGDATATLSDAAPRIAIVIADDGLGLSPGAPKGFGLRGMQERVHALGGTLALDSAPGRGTTVRIVIPIAEQRAGAPSAD